MSRRSNTGPPEPPSAAPATIPLQAERQQPPEHLGDEQLTPASRASSSSGSPGAPGAAASRPPAAGPSTGHEPGAVLRRAVDNVAGSWRGIADRARDVFTAGLVPGHASPAGGAAVMARGGGAVLPDGDHQPTGGELARKDVARVREEMRVCLDARGGEVAARRRAASLGRTYSALGSAGREQFLRIMAEFDVAPEAAEAAIARVGAEPPGSDAFRAAGQALREVLQPAWMQLFRQFNSLPEGVKFLVDLRADLREFSEHSPALRRMESDLRALLASWFDVGFLELQRITWDAPASLLEKLARYEAVHEVRTWLDLKNRLDVDRRCFAFFHPVMPSEPLIFVEVALTQDLSASVAELLDHAAPVADPRGASVAIFYSISNCQRGLAGISFGNALIKRVVDELQNEFRGLRTFATLSPIPGFREWLDARLRAQDAKPLVTPEERAALKTLADGTSGVASEKRAPLQAILSRRSWFRNAEIAAALRDPLMRLCAHYLMEEKRVGKGRQRTLDPVAHFHLSNGARMERLNWLADTSTRGLRESAGMMVNYVYRIDQIDDNSEAYLSDGKIAASQAMRALLR